MTIKDNIIYPMLLENNNKKCIEAAADKIFKTFTYRRFTT
ncbi:peptide ABC transporter ATP-binding protein [Clostridium botulinum A1 str. CFSAN002368]|nr:peptide ABC transporter ATP-binding protein [Clostridium botulinum A1 str. CFSAN002368]